MKHVTEKNNFVYLTVSLILLLLASALVDQFPGLMTQRLIQALTVITLAVSVIGFKNSKLWFLTGIGFLIAVLLVMLVGFYLESSGLNYLYLLILIGFYSLMTWLAARHMLFAGPIDTNRIIGMIGIYLMMGLVWALAYLFIAEAVPGAFNGIDQAPWHNNFAKMAYFSYVTLTTLGYGDISPVAPVARFLVYMEAITGAFYLAIIVASMVGIRTTKIQTDKSD